MATSARVGATVSPTNSNASTVSEAPPSPRASIGSSAFSFRSPTNSSSSAEQLPAFTFHPNATTTPLTAPNTRALSTVDDAEGVLVFPSRGASEFRYHLTLTTTHSIRIWLEDKTTKHQWESTDLTLDKIVSETTTIPTMKLRDYFEAFKSSLLAADTELFQGANKHDLVRPTSPGDNAANDTTTTTPDDHLELQLTVAVHVFAKVLTPTYRFALQRVPLTATDVVTARLRDQHDEVQALKAQVTALSEKLRTAARTTTTATPAAPPTVFRLPGYLHATTTTATARDEALVWVNGFGAATNGWFQSTAYGSVRFLRAGVYSVHVTVHHTNLVVPENAGLFGSPPPGRPAFQLVKNGVTLATSFGSTPVGAVLSSPLVHVLAIVPSDELTVVYCGTGAAMPGSMLVLTLLQ